MGRELEFISGTGSGRQRRCKAWVCFWETWTTSKTRCSSASACYFLLPHSVLLVHFDFNKIRLKRFLWQKWFRETTKESCLCWWSWLFYVWLLHVWDSVLFLTIANRATFSYLSQALVPALDTDSSYAEMGSYVTKRSISEMFVEMDKTSMYWWTQ